MIYQFEHMGCDNYFTIESKENYSYPKHLHQSFELVLILTGKMLLPVNETVYSLKAGDAVFLFPNQIHSFISQGFSHLLFIFSPDLISAYAKKYDSKIPKNNKFTLSEELTKRLRSLTTESSIYDIKGALYSVCGEFDRTAEYADSDAAKGELLFRIFDYVEKNHTKHCSLVDVAQALNYSTSHLCRYFKSIVGIPYNEYLNMRRLSTATYLLKNSSSNITEIAFKSGFQSIKTFNRNFKAVYGIAPRDYGKD